MSFVPPPAPPPPPAKLLPLAMLRSAPAKIAVPGVFNTSPALRVQGAPTISFPLAQKIAASAGTSPPANQYILDTVGAARAGNPQAQGNADLLTLAQKVQVQAKYVRKWFGDQAAKEILAAQHLAT